jgi:Rrf2 family transcriptional regulator, cysteine metabolism repressor
VRFSKRTEYAIRALVHFAKLGTGNYAQSRDIARQERLPTKFLESVLLGLKRHGFLESKVGSGGGYRLARPAGRVVIGDLIRKLEDQDIVNEDAPKQDAVAGESALHLIQERLVKAHAQVLDGLTLEELVDEVQKNAKSKDAMYYI